MQRGFYSKWSEKRRRTIAIVVSFLLEYTVNKEQENNEVYAD
jgi:hypothetical protein